MAKSWRIAAALALVAAVAVAAVGWDRLAPRLSRNVAAPQPPPGEAPAGSGDAQDPDPAPRGPTDRADAPAPPDAAANGAPADKKAAPNADAPRIGVLRVAPDGEAVLAGAADPGQTIDIMVDDRKIAEATADGRGEFVAFLSLPALDAPQRLTLAAQGEEPSDEAVILPTRREDGPDPSGAAPQTAAGRERESPEPTAQAQADAPHDGMTAQNADAPRAPTILRRDAQGVTFAQRPKLPAEAPAALDALSYDEFGGLNLQGRARPGRTVRIYAGDALIAQTTVAQDGGWRVASVNPPKRAGVLRVDEIGADGGVLSRSETPYRPPTELPRPLEPGEIVVQPGATLWEISDRRYGDGARYAVIFDANRDRIRNPDLIYPGQVLSLPGAATR